MSAQQVKQVNLDVSSAITTVLATIPRLVHYREEIIREFRSFEMAWFDGLEQYAMALSHANALYLTAGMDRPMEKRPALNLGAWQLLDGSSSGKKAPASGAPPGNARGYVSELSHIVSRLAPRWFVVRNTHAAEAGPILLRPRDTWSIMRGPLTRNELREVRKWQADPRAASKPQSHEVR